MLVLVRALERWFWAWPLFALGTALAGDRVRKRGIPVDTARFRVSESGESISLMRLACQQPLVSLPAVLSFVRIRRQVLNTLTAIVEPDGVPADAVADSVAAAARALRTQLETDSGLWEHVRRERTRIVRTRFNRLVQWPAVLAWSIVAAVGILPFAYFVIGGTSRWANVQDWFSNRPTVVVASTLFSALVTAVIAGLTVIGWSTIAETAGELKARLLMGLLSQGFALAGIGLILYRYQTIPLLDFPLITDIYHGLEAIAVMYMIVGLAAILLATGVVALPAGAVLLGVTTTELAIAGVLASATGLALLSVSSSDVGGLSELPGQTRVQIPGAPLPPIPPEVAIAAAAAAITAMTNNANGWQPDTPADPHHYVDANGNLRWRDTNQLVAHNPNRARYTGEDGIERWADTDQPVEEAAGTGEPASAPTDSLTDDERSFVEYEEARGRSPRAIPRASERTADFDYPSDPELGTWELKTISGLSSTSADSISGAIASRAMDGRGQSGQVVIDVRAQSGSTQSIAERGIRRAYGADNVTGGRLRAIRVIGSDFDITVPKRDN